MKHSTYFCKRILDLILVIPLIILLTPVWLFIVAGYFLCMLIFPDDRGPIIHRNFRKTRGELFLIYKFRVSRISHLKKQRLPENTIDLIRSGLNETEKISFDTHPEFHVEDGGMIKTRFGGLLKKIYMDELPQLFNILKGDMTFVGPRPFSLIDIRNTPGRDGKVDIKGQRVDYRFKDHLTSGLTGYYQLNKDYRAQKDYMQFVLEGFELDRKYYDQINRLSCIRMIGLDISIIVRSLAVVFRAEGI